MAAIIELFYEIDNVCLKFWQIKLGPQSFLNYRSMNLLQVMNYMINQGCG